ncbi:FAD/NAD(P)-binding protein [Nocardioides sp. YIM 152588]|uniref:FAD/NAD(P)-binding protein n=1 Tax=Nocardioides sp. YIM 152588 TaxID=3158259 RepID=UPI0032E3B286
MTARPAPAPPFPGAAAGVMVPRPFVVTEVRRDTRDTRTVRLTADDEPLAFAPGQFTMLSRFGVGEVPISISGDPAGPEVLEHTIRDVGGVTRSLAGAAVGDVLGVRGPFGHGWDVADGRGGDLVIVAGGIGLAPLRPAVLAVCADRASYGRVSLLYGARTPEDLLFETELRAWAREHAIDVAVTVDAGGHGWRGRVGVVTELVARARFDGARTLALLCGPEVMMRFTARALLDRGVAPDRLRLSMERNMQCGVGLCGHCQLRELFLCVDGPVLSHDRLAPLLTRAEL